jgi:aspartokinase-like uncharacterized kinase
MRVVKLGGSLLETGKLFDCLKHIIAQNQQTVVVCGGSVFADTVRSAQKKWRFNDVAAHEMAILAMQQNAMMCQNLQPEFVLFSQTHHFQQQHFSIWSPDITELNADNIASSWEITSDSLAAWLARKLKAAKLIVVKSCEIDSTLTITELTERFIVDGNFADFVTDEKFDLNVISATEFLNT